MNREWQYFRQNSLHDKRHLKDNLYPTHDAMKSLREHLEELDRKERNAVIRKVFKTENLQLSEEFISDLETTSSVTIPQDYYWALDYHIDWIYAALYSFYKAYSFDDFTPVQYEKNNSSPKFNQEDIDFLIYFNQNNTHTFIFIEAKYDTAWSNKQFKSKDDRLYFIEEKFKTTGVFKFHRILMSPSSPIHLKTNRWKWIKMAKKSSLYTISRCTEEGKKSVNGKYWSAF